MRWLQIARKDVADARRNRNVWLVAGLFVLLGAGMGYLYGDSDPSGGGTGLAGAMYLVLSALVTIVALMLAQNAVVEKAESGELTALLGLPFSRAEVVGGTFAGRAAVVAASAVAGMLVAPVVALALGAPVGAAGYLLTTLVVVLAGVAFVGIALGLSAATRSSTRAAAGAFGLFLLFFAQVWNLLPVAVVYVVNGFAFPESQPAWVNWFVELNPLYAMQNLLHGLVPRLSEMSMYGPVRTTAPAYDAAWFGLLVLAFWAVVPTLLGYWRFDRRDL